MITPPLDPTPPRQKCKLEPNMFSQGTRQLHCLFFLAMLGSRFAHVTH